MRAVVVERYGVPPVVTEVPDPGVTPDGVVVTVAATGLCRSDWHGWKGHDDGIRLPNVPGHEFAGTIAQVGAGVTGWSVGDRVTAPFVLGCGTCAQCMAGEAQVCPDQQQPGFTYWGSFAEYVAVPYAAVNLVRVPDDVDLDTAAGLGCRFATSYRAVRQVARVVAGESLVVFGCGGVGLSAVMVGAALGAQVIAVDTNPAALDLATHHGAAHALAAGPDVVARIRDLTGGGAHVTADAVGHAGIVQDALRALRPRGRHVQIGLLPGAIQVDVGALIGRELQWLGSHGMAAHGYPELLDLVRSGAVRPGELVTSAITLDDVPDALAALDHASPTGITVIHPG